MIALLGGTKPGAPSDDIIRLAAWLAAGGARVERASSALIARRVRHSSVTECFCRGTRDFI
jgi:hypothetical protein